MHVVCDIIKQPTLCRTLISHIPSSYTTSSLNKTTILCSYICFTYIAKVVSVTFAAWFLQLDFGHLVSHLYFICGELAVKMLLVLCSADHREALAKRNAIKILWFSIWYQFLYVCKQWKSDEIPTVKLANWCVWFLVYTEFLAIRCALKYKVHVEINSLV